MFAINNHILAGPDPKGNAVVQSPSPNHHEGDTPEVSCLPFGIETAFLMARLRAQVNTCGGTFTKRASALAGRPGACPPAIVSRGCACSVPAPGRDGVGPARGGRRRLPPQAAGP